jgi:NAD(P)-dependent dehydrogenase (short-subunit alcohol dehydrogenase family)
MVPIDLSGQVAMVTGSARGIGRTTALYLARAGADVVITWNSNREAAEALAREIGGLGRQALLGHCNVAETGEVDALAAAAVERFGHVDILVANAGAGIATPVTETSDAEHERVFGVNVRGFVAAARAVLPGMKARKAGRVVAVSSVVGRSGRAFRSTSPTYAGAKAAMLGYVKGMAVECGPYGITVNAVCPGWVDWEDAWGAKHGAAPAEVRERASSLIALGRTGTDDDIAGAILFLASPLAAYVTGVSLDVNGGLYMG